MVEIVYGKTSDGMKAAQVGNRTYCMVPSRNGFLIASSYGTKPIDQLNRSDFYGHEGVVSDENDFKLAMGKKAHHQRQLLDLNRQEYTTKMRTPWGPSQGGTIYAEGIHSHQTAGHGGFRVYKKQNEQIPEIFRNDDGWYEEDSEWAKVAFFHPAYFTDLELELAKNTLINWYPDEYEAHTGEVISEGMSLKKDERIFNEHHADDWVVISAIGKTADDGTDIVECFATKGGERSRYESNQFIEVEEAKFIVSQDEYAKRSRFGFVINPEIHQRVDEPVTEQSHRM